jgi:hypothetical protein
MMSSFAQYKIHNTKSTTPLTWFNCTYCGKYQSRRTSKIKNPNLIFCDNNCRAKYVSKKVNNFYFTNKDLQPYLFEFSNEINQIAVYVAKKSNVPDILEDLKKEAPYCIWKCLHNTKYKKIKKSYFCKYYKKHLFAYLTKYEYSEFYYSLDFYEESQDKVIELAYFKNLDITIDSINAVNNMTNDIKNLPISCQIAINRFIFDFDIDELIKKYNMTRRQVIYNCSKGKELLRLKYDKD